MQDLFKEFSPVSKAQWIAQAIKDLKGADFSTLEYTTPDGLKIGPFYTGDDIQAPEPVFTHTDWEVCVSIEVSEEATANQHALKQLEGGATALVFHLNRLVDFKVLLQDIGIQYIALQFHLAGWLEDFGAAFGQYLQEQGIDYSGLNLTISYDPIEYLIREGEWPESEDAAKTSFAAHIAQSAPHRNCCINGDIYHNAGAPPAYELACLLAHAAEYLSWLQDNAGGVSIQVNVATGPDYFTEIAKLRALRKLFALLLEQYDGARTSIYIHATSALRNLTVYDHYNNLLRTSTEAMAAVAGGCNSLCVLPYDTPYRQPNDFSERMARNTQLILKSESYFDKVSDMAAGSFFIESLTEALAEKAWTCFQEIEAAGGFLETLKQGSIQQAIKHFAAAEEALFAEGKKVLVGTNKFPAANQQMRSEITRELLADMPAGTTVQPLIPRRLAVKAELARLASETAKEQSL